MTSETHSPFVISLRDAACRRLVDVERVALRACDCEVDVALPVSYKKAAKKRYPLLLVLDTGQNLGSAIEMSRLMAQTREIHETIVVSLAVSIDNAAQAAVLADTVNRVIAACDQRYRTQVGGAIVYGYGAAAGALLQWLVSDTSVATRLIAADPPQMPVAALPSASTAASPVTSGATRQLVLCAGEAGIGARSLSSVAELLAAACPMLKVSTKTLAGSERWTTSWVHGLRTFISAGPKYGAEVVPLRNRLIMRALCALAPLLGRVTGKPQQAQVIDEGRYLMHCARLDRDFEIFVVLPPLARTARGRRYPALVVLDANIELSTAAETAARLAARGEVDDLIIIGIGTPRALGPAAFGFRRFEELSPPVDGYDFGDDLGRIFRSLFALRGQDARKKLGRAPDFLDFIARELLPSLQKSLPIDSDRIGLLGHSAGGTFVCYALSQAASPFAHYIGVSPGIGISGFWLTRQPRLAAASARSVHLSLGSEEIRNDFNDIAGIPHTAAYAHRLREETGGDVQFQCFEGETHSSIFPHAVAAGLLAAYGCETSALCAEAVQTA